MAPAHRADFKLGHAVGTRQPASLSLRGTHPLHFTSSSAPTFLPLLSPPRSRRWPSARTPERSAGSGRPPPDLLGGGGRLPPSASPSPLVHSTRSTRQLTWLSPPLGPLAPSTPKTNSQAPSAPDTRALQGSPPNLLRSPGGRAQNQPSRTLLSSHTLPASAHAGSRHPAPLLPPLQAPHVAR